MRRLVSILSALFIAGSIAAFLWLFQAAAPGWRQAGSLPENTRRTVHFRSAPDLPNAGDREDQLRDWLLYTVLEESGIDGPALRKAMFDVPPSRAEFVKPVASFEYGPSRYRIIDGKGTVVALIPAKSSETRDLIAQIADSARITLGTMPKTMRVFTYSIDPVELTAQITRTRDIPGSELFSQAYGFVDREVHQSQEFEALLRQLDDVTSVSMTGTGLRITGRTVEHPRAARMRVEDIAALWQSENHLSDDRKRIEAFEERYRTQAGLREVVDRLYAAERSAVLARSSMGRQMLAHPESYASQNLDQDQSDSFAAIGNFGTGRSSLDPGPNDSAETALAKLKARWNDKSYVHAALQKEHDREEAELRKSLSSKGSKGTPDGSGFSLDPAFDYEELVAIFDRLRPALAAAVPNADLDSIRQNIVNRQEGPFLDLLFNMQQDHSNRTAEYLGRIAPQILEEAKFQHARYDGSLSGTEVGMVLFYTDLLAKLWALDYLDQAPETVVPGFVPLLKVSVSPIYTQEVDELSGTRLWFGPRDSGYSKTGGQVLFSRIATRVYAASSNTLQPGKEAEANAASGHFLGWWNDHYSQVARFEPQYQRLNQIMKWSVILGWLSANQHLDTLGFLDSVQVKRDNWFPTWARANHDLCFHDWERIQFHQAGYKGVETESMPILQSKVWASDSGPQSYSGGVSLGSSKEVASRPELKLEIEPEARRANLEEIEGSPRGTALRSTDHIEFRFEGEERAGGVRVESQAKLKLRGTDMELKEAPFDVAFDKEPEGLRVSVAWSNHPVGELTITHGAGDDIDVLFEKRDTEVSREFSKTITRAIQQGESPIGALATRPDVNRVIASGETFYIEPRATRANWIKISPEGKPSKDIAGQADVRIGFSAAGNKPGSRWNVQFIDRQEANLELSNGAKSIVAHADSSGRPGVAFSVMGRGPPPPPGGKVIRDFASTPPDKNGGVLAVLDDYRKRTGPSGGGPGDGGPRPGDPGGFWGGDDEYRNVARDAARDPEKFFGILAEQRRASVAQSERLIEQGKFDDARVELDRLASVFPRDPEIQLRRAVAHTASGSPEAGHLASELEITPDQAPELVDMADAALKHLEPGSPEAQKLDALVRGTILKAEGRSVHYYSDGDSGLGVEVRLADLQWERDSNVHPDVSDLRYSFAVTDAPMSPHVGASPPVSEPITGKLHDLAIARLHPDTITNQKTGQSYRRVSGRSISADRPATFRYYLRSDSCSSASPEDRRGRPECSGDVYLTEPSMRQFSMEPTAQAGKLPGQGY